MKKLITFLLLVSLFSCENNQQIIEDPNNLLIGNWVNASFNDNKTTFTRANALPDNDYGISFKTNGDYVEKSSGWCGTPPLSFFDVVGNYKLKDNLITVDKADAPTVFAWKIISLTETTLVVEREVTEQELDHQKLMDLYVDFSNMAYSDSSCTNSSDVKFVAYGAKACGGPKGYIGYTNNMNTALLLQKIENYTRAEKEYNIKWNITSDCSVIPAPKSVECKRGKPRLIY